MLRVVVLGLLVLMGSCGSEDFTKVESERSSLIGGFQSYASREEVAKQFPADVEVKVIRDTSLAKDDSQPPYRVYVITLSPYKSMNTNGTLRLTFYNNRLEQTAFYPADYNGYVEALGKQGVSLSFGREVVRGHTLIWEGQDEDNKPFIGWADKRLREQQRRWLAKFN